MKAFPRALACVLLIATTIAARADRAIVVPDASDSRWGQIAGKAVTLREAAIETMAQVVTPPPPPSAKVGKNLRVTSRAAVASAPFTDADAIHYDVHRLAANGNREAEIIETNHGADSTSAEFLLPAGRYAVVASKDLASAEVIVDVTDAATTEAGIVLNAGSIKARAMAAGAVPIADGSTRFDITDAAGKTDTSYGPTRTLLINAGAATVKSTLRGASKTVPVEVIAGTTVEVDVILDAGTSPP